MNLVMALSLKRPPFIKVLKNIQRSGRVQRAMSSAHSDEFRLIFGSLVWRKAASTSMSRNLRVSLNTRSLQCWLRLGWLELT